VVQLAERLVVVRILLHVLQPCQPDEAKIGQSGNRLEIMSIYWNFNLDHKLTGLGSFGKSSGGKSSGSGKLGGGKGKRGGGGDSFGSSGNSFGSSGNSFGSSGS
jgi:hypothetical protein